MKTWVIVTAAGKSRRMKVKNKMLISLGGRPVLWWSLRLFSLSPGIDGIVIVGPSQYLKEYMELANSPGIEKIKAVVEGGTNRQESVFNGLRTVPEDVDLVAVHDGARPMLSSFRLERLLAQAEKHGAAILAHPVHDSLKKVKDGIIQDNFSREGIWAAQTPQAFKREILVRAFEKAREDGYRGTDEASLVSRLPYDVHVVLGSLDNIKLTTAEDIAAAKNLILKRARESASKVLTTEESEPLEVAFSKDSP
ncbi:MAG: 2-C-methyl-D-erythritol 4-phosphate cytidylyltransferase [Chloroflexi bacterium]|nr:2-C-methyl-D-erythritol 4-phosphate cytidylyltransferase [Chloroflexota bacterium]